MPELLALAIAYAAPATAATVFTIGATAVSYAMLISYAVVIGASIAYSSSQSAKLRRSLSTSSIDQGRTVMVRDPLAARRLVYGQVLLSGAIFFAHTSGTKNEYLHLIVGLAGHECHEIGEIRFGNEVVPLDGSGNATGKYAGYARIKKFVGLAAGERDTDLETESGGLWTANHLGKGIARLHIRLKHSPDLFPAGMPTVKALVKGKKVYDWRTGLTVWSANAALCSADYLMDPVFGKGVALARIVSADVIEAANLCDENIVLDDASTEKRYTVNGTINADQDPTAVLFDLAGAMAGHIVDTGGTWTIRAGGYRTPDLTLDDNDLVGSFDFQPRQSRQDTFNRVRGIYISPDNQWAAGDFPAVPNSTYKAKDGGIWLDRDVQYNFTTSSATAQRLAKIELERGRQQITFTALYSLKAMRCMPGDVIMVTRAKAGWASKEFEVIEWQFQEMGEGDNRRLAISLSVRETAASVWDWANGEETTVDLAPNTNLPDSTSVPTPSTPTLASGATNAYLQNDGTVVPRMKVSWPTPNNTFVEQGGKVRIEYRPTGGPTWYVWNEVRGDVLEDYITDLRVGVGFDVRIQFQNSRGARGLYSPTATHTVTGDTSGPAAPTTLVATAGTGKAVSLDWDDNTEADLGEYVVFRNSINNSATSHSIAEVRASRFVDIEVTLGTTYYYWVKAVDRSENISGFSNGVSATPGAIGSGSVDGTPPATPSAPAVASTTTYQSGDGTVFARANITMPAMPSGGVLLNLYYGVQASPGWLLADQTASGGGTSTLDDLTPGVTYEIVTAAISPFGVLSAYSTAVVFTAPNKTAGPGAPTNLTVTSGSSASFARPPRYLGGIMQACCRLNWDAPADKDVDFYEYAITATDTDGAADVATKFGVKEREAIFGSFLPAALYFRVRSRDRTGNASAWTALGSNLILSIGMPAGNMSEQNKSDVNVSGVKTGSTSAASVRQVVARYPFDDVVTLTGGAPTETVFVSLTNRGFTTKPEGTTGGINISNLTAEYQARYDWDDAGNSSTQAAIIFSRTDGANIPASLAVRFTGEFFQFT